MNVKKYFEEFYKTTKNPTLKAMEYFMDELGHPEKKVKIIHIAGTNGKGSVTEMLTNILVKSGYKVGKYMSPHLLEYNERISVNQKNITDTEMEAIIEKLIEKIEKYNKISKEKVTLFELLTTMALYYFAEQKCDFAIIETGLGGLYDSTNIVNSMVSIITSIGYDHMQILGNTLEEIAFQKAGIIKKDANTVIMEQIPSVQKVIADTCKQKNNNLKVIKKDEIRNKRYKKDIQLFDYKEEKNIKVNLKGDKQFENAAVCIETINIIRNYGYKINEDAIREGLSSVVHKARFETLQESPKIIYDGAHNEEAILNLINTINQYYKEDEKIYIISILKTKDYKEVLKRLLKDEESTFILTSGNDEERYVASEELYKVAREITKNDKIYIKSLEDAIIYAKKQRDKVTFIVGSFYVYGDVIEKLKKV